MSIGWGLLADIDIESERLRMIGEARFTVWALARVMRKNIICLYRFVDILLFLPSIRSPHIQSYNFLFTS